eukprot:380372-Rhodomonas_salina.7
MGSSGVVGRLGTRTDRMRALILERTSEAAAIMITDIKTVPASSRDECCCDRTHPLGHDPRPTRSNKSDAASFSAQPLTAAVQSLKNPDPSTSPPPPPPPRERRDGPDSSVTGGSPHSLRTWKLTCTYFHVIANSPMAGPN